MKMFQHYRPGHITRTPPPAPTPGLGKAKAARGCCPVCWGYGKAIPLRTPCPICDERRPRCIPIREYCERYEN